MLTPFEGVSIFRLLAIAKAVKEKFHSCSYEEIKNSVLSYLQGS